MITYAAEDLIWGPEVDVTKMHQRLTSNGIKSVHIDFKNSDEPNSVIEAIKTKLTDIQTAPKAIFVRFLDEGHNPRPNTNSAQLSSKLAEVFLKHYLTMPK